jgi:hypothetical protein
MPEWITYVSEDLCVKLQSELSYADVKYQRSGLPPDALIYTLDRIGPLQIQVFSNEHPPPHFRVICNAGRNDFKISDCTPLHGNELSRFFRQIREWHKTNKQKLITTWNDTRPSDCPVGLYRE